MGIRFIRYCYAGLLFLSDALFLKRLLNHLVDIRPHMFDPLNRTKLHLLIALRLTSDVNGGG